MYDCRDTCGNVNQLDLIIERHAADVGRDKGDVMRGVHRFLLAMWDSGREVEDMEFVREKPSLDDVMGHLEKMMEEVKGLRTQ